MYYGNMSKQDILNSSRKFLYAIYQEYVNRACENLGVSNNPQQAEQADDFNGTPLTDADYPSEFVTFTQEQREQAVAESELSDEDFMRFIKM